MTGEPTGLLVVDKPAGWTSHDVVAKLRGVLHTKKVGHSGTLDPDATGVLLVGVGRVTRLLRFLNGLPKSYEGEMVLGVETATLDAAGEVTATHDMSGVTESEVHEAARRFRGSINQVPPMVSAVKVGGRRLHELARQGIEVEREPRPVDVYQLDLHATDDPTVWGMTVQCSSGTYIRTLAADIGHALGGGAHLRNLRRTAIGSFTLAEAKALDSVSDTDLLPAADALRDLPLLVVGAETALLVAHGRTFDRAALTISPGDAGPWRVVDETGNLLAVYEPVDDSIVKPAVVVSST